MHFRIPKAVAVFLFFSSFVSPLAAQPPDERWSTLLHAGDSLKFAGDVQQALVHYFSALRKAETDSAQWEIAVTAERLGDLHEKYYRYHESVPYLKRSYRILKKTDSISFLARVTNSIAWNFIKLNQHDSAMRYAEESVGYYQQSLAHELMNYCIALESLGEIYSKRGRFQEASDVLNLCFGLGKKAGNEVIVGFSRYGLALNEYQQGNVALAHHHIEQCVPVAEKYASRELLADVYKLAYHISIASGMPAKAIHYLQRYSELKDQLHSEDIEKKAAIVNANYEIQQKEADLRISNQRNAIQHLEIQQQRLVRNIFIALAFVLVIMGFLIYSRIQGKRKFEQLELNRKKEEMEQARKVQLSLLPKTPLHDDAFNVEGKMVTATEVGGDYYDYIRLDQDRVLIAFGDATGHGTAAGMLVTITKVTLINNLALLKESNNVVPLAKVINESILSSISVKGIGMALQLCLIDRHARKISLTSCGMPYPMLLNTKSQSLAMMEIKQPPLGFFKSTKIDLTEIDFGKEMKLILVSDGILERFNPSRNEYGINRLSNVLRQSCRSNANSTFLVESIFSDTETFAEGIAHEDDMTVLVAEVC